MTSKNKVYVQRTFKCNQRELFEWLTKPELIAQWFGPEGFSVGEVKCDLVTGGSYSIDLKSDRTSFTVTGEYIEIEAPKLLSFSYRYIGVEGRPPSTVTFKVSKIDDGNSELHMVQEFEIETPDFATRSKAWNFMLDRLVNLVSDH